LLTIGPSALSPRQEWPAGLDLAELRRTGWKSVPFQQFIVKIHGRCDLACTYCYVFQSPDISFRQRTTAMTPAVADATCDRIVEHAVTHGLPEVAVVLHGGEPLLAPPSLADRIADRLRRGLPTGVDLGLTIQTNAVTLTAGRLDRLLDAGYRIGVSLDGDAEAHDRHRIYANGNGSYSKVDSALRLFGSRPGGLAGILCTVDLQNDPIRTYEALAGYHPPVIDFLLPHGNWDTPPPGRGADARTPYGSWLAAVFDRWYDDEAAPDTDVRIFTQIVRGLLGGPSTSELIGLSPAAVVVVETDGAIEQVDTLKTAYDGAPATGRSVLRDSFDAVLETPGIVARQIGERALADDCLRCPVVRICGGGYYPHRYRTGYGYRNPSIFSPDLRALIEHIARRTGLPRTT
jgi:uncharacterized protein